MLKGTSIRRRFVGALTDRSPFYLGNEKVSLSRYAIFADAGYLWVQFGFILQGQPTPRTSIKVDIPKFAGKLQNIASKIFPGKELLRIYWYDGVLAGLKPSEFNQELASQDGFKLRYGTVNSVGQQKGVDGLLMADLLSLGQNRAISDALIISGDGDLAPGVAAAQGLGIRVHRLELGPSEATSPILRNEVDANAVWGADDVRACLSFSQTEHESTTPTGCLIEEGQVKAFVATLNEGELSGLLTGTEQTIPRSIDGRLLATFRQLLGRDLTFEERNEARAKLLTLAKSHESTLSVESVNAIIAQWQKILLEQGLQSQFSELSVIPKEHDRLLLQAARKELKRALDENEKKSLRTRAKNILTCLI